MAEFLKDSRNFGAPPSNDGMRDDLPPSKESDQSTRYLDFLYERSFGKPKETEINSGEIDGKERFVIDFKDGTSLTAPQVEQMFSELGTAPETFVGSKTSRMIVDYIKKNNPTKDQFIKHFSSVDLNKGGVIAMNNQMQQFGDGGLNDEGGEIDEVSGNEVPIGGTKEGVRDDIPANVSEGEFIFPADVVRFIGLDKLMSIRQDAKMGLKKMEAMGQMGNGDEATMPDDMPFGMEDLMVVSSDDAPMEFAVGGFVPVENYTKVQDMISDKAEKSSVPKTNEDMQPQNFAPGGVVGNMAGQLANATASNVDTSAATKAPANTTFDNPTTGQEAFIDDGGPELRRPSIPRTPSEQRFLDTADVPTTDSNEVIDYDSYMNGVVTEVREYRDAEGNVTLITFINGVPTSPIPENFTLYVPPEDEAVADGTPAAIAAVINNNKDDNDSRQVNTAPTPINYAEMGDAEFAERMEYENGKGYQTQKFLGLAISSLIPLGGMFAYGSMRSHARKSEQRLNSMIRNAGTAEEASRLTSIRDGVLKNAKLKSTEESGALGTWVDSWLLGQGYTKDQAVTGASSVTVVAKQGLDVIEPDNNIAAQNLQVAAQNEEERLGIDPPAEVEAQQTSDDVGASATPEQLAKQNENKSSDDTLDAFGGAGPPVSTKAKSVVSQEDMGDVSDRMLQPRTPEGSASSGTAPSEGIPAELKSEKPSTEPTVSFFQNKKMFGVNSAFGNLAKSMLGDNFKDKDEVASVAPRNLPPQEDMSNVSDRMTQPAKTFVPEGFDYNQATSDQQGAGATSSQLAAQADPDRFDPRGREQRATPKVQSAFTGATMDTVEQTASAFDQGVPRSPAPETFDQAFKRNKAAGRTAFTFSDGKSYTTETVEERKAKPALPSSASTASNTLYQTAANLLTPGDGKSYEGGVLKNEANKRVNTLYQNTANAFTKNDGRSYVDGVLIDDVTKKPYVEKGSKGNSTPDPSVYGYTGSDEKGNAIGKVSDGRTSGVLADNDGKVIRDSKNRTIYVDEEGNQYVKTDLLGIGREAVKAPVQVNKEDKDPPVVAKPKPVVKTGDGGVTAAKKIVATQNSQSKQDKSDERAAARAATKTTKASTKEYKTQKETKAATDKAVEKYGRATGARAKGGLINRPKAKAKTTNKRGLAARK